MLGWKIEHSPPPLDMAGLHRPDTVYTRPIRRSISQIMIETDEFFGQISLVSVLNPLYIKGCKFFHAAADSAEGLLARTFKNNLLGTALTFSFFVRKDQHTPGFQKFLRIAAFPGFQPVTGPFQFQQFTYCVRQLPSADATTDANYFLNQ